MLNLGPIIARDKARTQGKWRATGPTHRGGFIFGENEILYGGTTIVGWSGFDSADGTKRQKRRNARFLAACSVDIPALIAEVERLRCSLARFVGGMQPGQRIGCPEDWDSELSQARALLGKETPCPPS